MSKIAVGLCQCGCGGKTVIVKRNSNGQKKGEYRRFIQYHWKHTEAEVIEHFWEKVDIRSKKECWEWQAARDSRGWYGFFKFRGKHMGAHRVAYILTKGEIPDGLDIAHVCDFPACCNPAHLFTATASENAQDMIDKGRDNWSSGMDRPGVKLTDDMVRDIRKHYKNKDMTQKEMAKAYNVSDTTIWDIVHRNRWRHITGD